MCYKEKGNCLHEVYGLSNSLKLKLELKEEKFKLKRFKKSCIYKLESELWEFLLESYYTLLNTTNWVVKYYCLSSNMLGDYLLLLLLIFSITRKNNALPKFNNISALVRNR